jgi:hypothetical protein
LQIDCPCGYADFLIGAGNSITFPRKSAGIHFTLRL